MSPTRWLWLPAGVLTYFLYFFGLSRVGMLGPDEPRYAAIGLAMARSGDWITPRLWGQPWFEKPPFLYWTTALGFRAGLGPDLAPRLPVALLSVAFLIFFFAVLRREYGPRAAAFASAILGACAGWLSYSRVAVMDLPLAAFLGAAMLLLLRPNLAHCVAAGLLLGLAVLDKGLVPFVLFLPAFWLLRRTPRRIALVLALMAAAAAPWYILVTLQNGREFAIEFFWRQQAGRFFTSELEHVQPFWFYIPVILAAFFPWTPVLVLLFQRRLFSGRRERFLLAWFLWGFIFFSASRNKLPGYLLPLLPPLAALLGIALANAARAVWPLAFSAILLFLIPTIAAALPAALAAGLSRAHANLNYWILIPVLFFAACAGWLEARGSRGIAVGAIALLMAAGAVYMIRVTFPVLDRSVSPRSFWRDHAPSGAALCSSNPNRSWRYGLNYYAGRIVPDCER